MGGCDRLLTDKLRLNERTQPVNDVLEDFCGVRLHVVRLAEIPAKIETFACEVVQIFYCLAQLL